MPYWGHAIIPQNTKNSKPKSCNHLIQTKKHKIYGSLVYRPFVAFVL